MSGPEPAAAQSRPPLWEIDPEHGRVMGKGFLGDAHHTLRTRELFKYYQPPPPDTRHVVPPLNHGDDFVAEVEDLSPSLISSTDPVLASFANLTARLVNARRSIITMTAQGVSYVIAESTRSLSLGIPHTHDPGDQLFLGGGSATESIGGLCEHTISLVPPDPDSDEPLMLEIPDLRYHPKYADAGYVRCWPYGRFYAGVPMRTRNGVSIGTVCVMDDKPRLKGLSPAERMQLLNMADVFMKYLETKQGDRDLRKGKMMEMELSRFIAEGFLPGDGAAMVERRNGRLWSEKMLEERRNKELERKKKVEEKRQLFQEMQYAEMVRRVRETKNSTRDKYADLLPNNRAMETSVVSILGVEPYPSGKKGSTHDLDVDSQCRPKLSRRSSSDTFKTRYEEPQRELPILIAHARPTQPGIIEICNITSEEDPVNRQPSLMETLMRPISSKLTSEMLAMQDAAKEAVQNELPRPTEPIRSRKSSSLSTSGTIATGDFTVGTADTTAPTLSDTTSSGKRRRSNYEQTTSVEPHFRSMFARAATLIRGGMDANVVFVDGDLEGFFAPEEVNVGSPSDIPGWGTSYVSTDPDDEAQKRANRPKAQRQRSGILGYSTAGGDSSTTRNWMARLDHLSRRIGFDVSELNEEILHRIVRESPDGQIVAHIEQYPGLEDPFEFTQDSTEQVLQKFLPGCKSVVIVPLYDHNRKLFAVCFAWTCVTERTFCGDIEGNFVSAVANSIMMEITRLNILNADKAKSEFISSISHELRSPLHGILASAQFLADTNLDRDQRALMDTVISCGATLLDTINHCLEFQKLNVLNERKLVTISENDDDGEPRILDTVNEESGSEFGGSQTSSNMLVSLSSKLEADLSTLVQDVVEGCSLGYGFKGISPPVLNDLSILGNSPRASPQHSPQESPQVSPIKEDPVSIIIDIEPRAESYLFQANPAAFKRIINNLVGNAMKYNRPSGWIRIYLCAENTSPDPTTQQPRAKVKLVVSDSGKGISREFLKTRLFTPFSQENPLSAGAGLGMSIVRQIVAMMGGKIDVKSQVGKGTTVACEMVLVQKDALKSPMTVKSQEDSIEAIMHRTKGKTMRLVGFNPALSPTTIDPLSSAAIDPLPTGVGINPPAETLLRESFVRYASEYSLKIIDEHDPGQADVILVNEITGAAASMLESLLPRNRKPCAVVIMSQRVAGDQTSIEKLLPNVNLKDRMIYLRKPCGPLRFSRAMKLSMDIVESGGVKGEAVVSEVTSAHSEDDGANLRKESLPDLYGYSIDDATSPSPAPLGPPAAPSEITSSPPLSPTQVPTSPWRPPPSPIPDIGAPVETGVPSPPASVAVLPSTAAVVPTPLPLSLPSPPPRTQSAPSQLALGSVANGKAPTPGKPMILAVEDNPINMMLLTTYLKKRGYGFDKAVDGMEALEMVRRAPGRYDVVLMDLQMPVLSGIESTREIRLLESAFPDAHPRAYIVALTGLAAQSDRCDAFSAGVDAFMVKPINFKELQKMLERYWDGVLKKKCGVEETNERGDEDDIERKESMDSSEMGLGRKEEIEKAAAAAEAARRGSVAAK